MSLSDRINAMRKRGRLKWRPKLGGIAWCDWGASDPKKWDEVEVLKRSMDRGYVWIKVKKKEGRPNLHGIIEVHVSRLHQKRAWEPVRCQSANQKVRKTKQTRRKA
jgi:hypothetical protein